MTHTEGKLGGMFERKPAAYGEPTSRSPMKKFT
jgi:hypothetical protein